MNEIFRGHFSRPVNREHFIQLCKALVEEHWKESFKFEEKLVRFKSHIHLWRRPSITNFTIGVNCQWHGESAPVMTIRQIDEAVAAAKIFNPSLKQFFIFSNSASSQEVDIHVAQLNRELRLNGQFTLALWCWDSIDELLITCKQTAKSYLSVGMSTNPYWLGGSFEYQKRSHLLPCRMPTNKKKDRNQHHLDGQVQLAFSDSVVLAFREKIFATKFLANTRNIKVVNHEPMGHAIALLHDEVQLELWILTPEPRDAEFRAETYLWVLFLVDKHLKQTFAHLLLKNYHQQNLITLKIHFVLHNKKEISEIGEFTSFPKPVELVWNKLFPREELKNLRCSVAAAVIENDHVKFTQSAFVCGCVMTHVYSFPVSSVSDSIIKKVLQHRFFPQAIPHSHEIHVDDDKVYYRSLSEFEQHVKGRTDQQETGLIRKGACQICHGVFFGYPSDKWCAKCHIEKSIFGNRFSYSDLLNDHITRPQWDF
jgi:hypothetical protein